MSPSYPLSKRLLVLGLLSLIFVIATAACGSGGNSTPTKISVASLVLGPDQWQGKKVEVTGTLRRFTDPDGTSYGVIEDGEQNRIGLRQIDSWSAFVGQPVDATGVVEFDDTFGWYLANPTIVRSG